MKNQVTQLSFDFECVQEQVSLTQKEVKCKTKKVRYSISRAEFEAQMELEKDLMYGRGAWLYAQLEREMAHERKNARALAEFEALRAEAYKYNF